MAKNPDDKGKAYIDRDVWDMFRYLVQMRYGSAYGHVGEEAEWAIQDRMNVLIAELETARPNIRELMVGMYGEGWDGWNADCPGCGARVRKETIADGKCPRCIDE